MRARMARRRTRIARRMRGQARISRPTLVRGLLRREGAFIRLRLPVRHSSKNAGTAGAGSVAWRHRFRGEVQPMCGIVGYVGHRPVQELLLAGLRKLEYRGYDSAGISTIADGEVASVRAVGNLEALERALAATPVGAGA